VSSRLFAVGIAGPALEPAEREVLATHPPRGVILFRRNIEDGERLMALVDELRALGVRHLFLDQEGGPVDRLSDVLGAAPSLRRAARAASARRAGAAAGAALATFGFDVDLAPVVDRAVEGAGALVLGERSASANPDEIIRAAGEFLDGLHGAGVGGCLKHFPGLGRAAVDSHRSLPIVPHDAGEEALDLAPFRALMERAKAVMISHAAGPDGVPASLSRARATVLLRGGLGFGGAAFSDDLEMGALDAFGGMPERCARASEAGCDLLFVCRRIQAYPACIEAVERLVPRFRRDEAARRLDGYAAHLEALRRTAGPPLTTLAAIRAELKALGQA
jgi:beta-N-acetylhexosaminidase